MKDILLVIQIIVSVGLVALILMQAQGSGLGSAFGGSGGVYRSKRGVEKFLIYFTIGLALIFFILSIVQVLI